MSPKEVIGQWIEAFNERDALKGADLYHEDAQILQIAFENPLIGREAIYQDLKQFFEHNPDNETHIVSLYQDGEWAILEWKGNATYFENPSAVGKPFKLRGCGIFHVVNGKIKSQRGYFDKHTWFKQVGIPLE